MSVRFVIERDVNFLWSLFSINMKYLLRGISNFQKMTLRRSLILVAALLCFGVFLGFCIQESGKI